MIRRAKPIRRIALHATAVLLLALFAALALGSATGPSRAEQRRREKQRAAQQAERERQAQAWQELEARRARQVEIDVLSAVAGTILFNDQETGHSIRENVTVRIVLNDVSVGEHTVAVRDVSGNIMQAASPVNITNNAPRWFTAIVPEHRSQMPNAPEDFTVVQTATGITITRYTGTRMHVVIPETLHGQRVTGIGNSAFISRNLFSVVIPNSVQTIGANAFASNRLTELVIPNSVQTIGVSAFSNNQLTTVTLGRGVQLIEGNAFHPATGISNINTLTILAPLSVRNTERVISSDGHLGTRLTQGLAHGVFNFGSLTRVTLPANIHVDNLAAFPAGLAGFYQAQGRRAGTYVRSGPVWTLE